MHSEHRAGVRARLAHSSTTASISVFTYRRWLVQRTIAIVRAFA